MPGAFAAGFHVFGLEWRSDAITSAQALLAPAQQRQQQPLAAALTGPRCPCHHLPPAVSIDGVATRMFVPRSLNPSEPGGWFADASGAPENAPFDAPFTLTLNVAVGGRWPGDPDPGTPFPATMLVDYVRVWGVPAPGADAGDAAGTKPGAAAAAGGSPDAGAGAGPGGSGGLPGGETAAAGAGP